MISSLFRGKDKDNCPKIDNYSVFIKKIGNIEDPNTKQFSYHKAYINLFPDNADAKKYTETTENQSSPQNNNRSEGGGVAKRKSRRHRKKTRRNRRKSVRRH